MRCARDVGLRMRGIRGRVVDEHDAPLAGVLVAVEAWDSVPPHRLCEDLTDARGGFAFDALDGMDALGPEKLGLGVFDALGLRPLARAATDVERVVVPRGVAAGWTATWTDGTPVRLSRGNELRFLVDSELGDAFLAAVRGARRTLHVAQLRFDPEFSASHSYSDRPSLLRELVEAARRGVRVRMLLNDNALLTDSVDEVREVVDAAGVRGFEVRAYPMSPNVMHAKTLLVDDEVAFLMGPPFQPDYWDTRGHAAHEHRRAGGRALHDVSTMVRGPAVAHLHEVFAALWNQRDRAAHGGGDQLAPISPPAPAGKVSLQLVATLPPHELSAAHEGEATLLESYLRALATASRYVYIETQYFTSPTVCEAIARALRRSPSLEVIVVLNEDTDVPGYIRWQKRRLREMGYPHEPRLGVFVLRNGGKPLYVHSKVAFADDAWASVGTANLDSMSLETADEFGAQLDPNVDVNWVVLDGIEGHPRTGLVGHLRRNLWAEHFEDHGMWRSEVPEGSWLSLWREVAEGNARRAARREPLVGRVLPYRPPELAPMSPRDAG